MQIKLPCSYYYKGSTNIYVRLDSFVEGAVEIYSDYNELMSTVTSYSQFRKFMDDLMDDKYA